RCICVIRYRLDVCYLMVVTSGSVPSQVTLPCHPRPGCYSTGAADLLWGRALRYDAWLHLYSRLLCPHYFFSSCPLLQRSTPCAYHKPEGARNTMPTPTPQDALAVPGGLHSPFRFHAPHVHLAPVFGSDWFGVKAEAFARFFGTPLFLVAQTLIVAV